MQLQSSTPRRLAIMRHAKADQDGPTDFERGLTDRGRRDAADAGAWLADQGFEPEHVLVSAARRAVETWEHVARGAGWDLDPELDRGLYAADPETTLDLIRLVDDDVRDLMVIGHNPTTASLAQLLDDGDGDPDAQEAMTSEFPTSAVPLFEYRGSWADLHEATARLVSFHVGRG